MVANAVKSNAFRHLIADSLLNEFVGSRVILLKQLTKEEQRNIKTYTEYNTGSAIDIKQFEVSDSETGYTLGGQLINNPNKKDDDGIYISCDDIIFINNNFNFEVYGVAIIKNNYVILTYLYGNKSIVKNSDVLFALPQSKTEHNILIAVD